MGKKLKVIMTVLIIIIAENEVTVTITLSEYRKLVQEVATKKYDIDRANSATYEAKRQLEKFKNQYFEELKKEYGENAEDAEDED